MRTFLHKNPDPHVLEDIFQASQCRIKSMNILLAIVQLLDPTIRTYVPIAIYIHVFNQAGFHANVVSSVFNIAHVHITAATEQFYEAKRMIRGLRGGSSLTIL